MKIPFTFLLLLLPVLTAHAQKSSLSEQADLRGITIYERTGVMKTFYFAKDGPELNERRTAPLSYGNNDFAGIPGRELYDVYYSDAQGNFDRRGEFVSIVARFDEPRRGGGGNIVAVQFNYAGGVSRMANFLADYHASGPNYRKGSERNAVDGSLESCTTLGSTQGGREYLRLTVGFKKYKYVENQPYFHKDIPQLGSSVPATSEPANQFYRAATEY